MRIETKLYDLMDLLLEAKFNREKTELLTKAGSQIGNRLLVPPDGITLARDTRHGILGNAWMALPLTPPGEDR